MLTIWKDKKVPEPPFYAVIFIATKSETLYGYEEMDERMMDMAHQRTGFLGYSSISSGKNTIFISYWKDQESIRLWSHHPEHRNAKSRAQIWYKSYYSLITKVESHSIFDEMAENLSSN